MSVSNNVTTVNKHLINDFNNRGFLHIKKLYPITLMHEIKNEVIQISKEHKNYLPVKNISAYNYNSPLLRGSNGVLAKNISLPILEKGLNEISKYSNSLSIRDPLLKVNKLNKIIFNDKIYQTSKTFFGKYARLGYVKLGITLKNKLPLNCVNFFHTDDLEADIKIRKSRVLKFSVTLNYKKNTPNSEYFHLGIHKSKLDFTNQYIEKKILKNKYSKFVLNPKSYSGDVFFFDPCNFFHLVEKPRIKHRFKLFFEIHHSQNKNYKIMSKVKIFKEDFCNLNNKFKKFADNFNII